MVEYFYAAKLRKASSQALFLPVQSECCCLHHYRGNGFRKPCGVAHCCAANGQIFLCCKAIWVCRHSACLCGQVLPYTTLGSGLCKPCGVAHCCAANGQIFLCCKVMPARFAGALLACAMRLLALASLPLGGGLHDSVRRCCGAGLSSYITNPVIAGPRLAGALHRERLCLLLALLLLLRGACCFAALPLGRILSCGVHEPDVINCPMG